MKNELKIPGCDYWGEYDGYKVYKCYSRGTPTSDYPNIVFAIGNNLFMNGGCVGKVDDAGRVSSWAPSKWVKKEKSKPKTALVEFDTATFKVDTTSEANSINVDEILNNSWKRTVEELVGEKFSVEYKYSE